jgi:hypothetical protein
MLNSTSRSPDSGDHGVQTGDRGSYIVEGTVAMRALDRAKFVVISEEDLSGFPKEPIHIHLLDKERGSGMRHWVDSRLSVPRHWIQTSFTGESAPLKMRNGWSAGSVLSPESVPII